MKRVWQDEARKLESQNKPMEVKKDRLNLPAGESGIRRGEPADVNQLKHALIGGIDVAIERPSSDKQGTAFKKAKAREILNVRSFLEHDVCPGTCFGNIIKGSQVS